MFLVGQNALSYCHRIAAVLAGKGESRSRRSGAAEPHSEAADRSAHHTGGFQVSRAHLEHHRFCPITPAGRHVLAFYASVDLRC